MAQSVVLTKDLVKIFPGRRGTVRAVDGVDLSVQEGEVFGFLGPNGAGKTTTLRMLATLMKPDSGTITIAGFDAAKNPGDVRRHIGYVGQNGGSDRPATGVENLILQGRLYGMTYRVAKDRAQELVTLLQLDEFADRIVHTYSGGQRRRLDVALGIMHRPDVLFLDEPTVGLDPQNRANLWDQIRVLKAQGVTIFLTTHYMEEADALSDRLTIIDQGRIVAEGTPESLKQEVGGECISITIEHQDRCGEALVAEVQRRNFALRTSVTKGIINIYVHDSAATVAQLLSAVDHQGVTLRTITITEPSLDDVFLQKTGYTLRDKEMGGGNHS
jgi:ABC-2 type transport system ATP-binding protein